MNTSALNLTAPTVQRQQPPVAIKPVAGEGVGGPTARTKPPVVVAPPDVVVAVKVSVATPSFSTALNQAQQGQRSPQGQPVHSGNGNSNSASHMQHADERQLTAQDAASKAPPRTATGTGAGTGTHNAAAKSATRPAARNGSDKPSTGGPVRPAGSKSATATDEAAPADNAPAKQKAQDEAEGPAYAGQPGWVGASQVQSALEKGADASVENAAALDALGQDGGAGDGATAVNLTSAATAAQALAAQTSAAKTRGDDKHVASAASDQTNDWQATLQAATQAQASSDGGPGGPGAQTAEMAQAEAPGFDGDVTAILVTPQGTVPVGGATTDAFASGASATGHLSAHPNSADFAPQLGAQLSTFVRDGVHHAQLELNPADMGPLTLQIQLDGNTATVNLSAENALTREALEKAMPVLAGSLREAGLTLSGGGVFEQARQPGQQGAQDPSQNTSTGARGSQNNDPPNNEGRMTLPPLPPRRRGVVDLMA
jgi:flagellar hook-length control protein FliK